MAYAQLSDLAGLVPAEFLTQALDDVNAGVIDDTLFAQIQADVQTAIDAILGTRFSVPFIPDGNGNLPAFIFNAAKKLTAEQLYKRRGVADDKNPWTHECDNLRALMKAMALGQAPLDPGINRKDPSASIITQPMKSTPRGGDTLSV
jgi:phage gp36-like protein